MNTFTHTQITPSDEWTVIHNLNAYPVSDVVTVVNGETVKIMPMALEYVDANTIIVRFSEPREGSIRLVGLYTYTLPSV